MSALPSNVGLAFYTLQDPVAARLKEVVDDFKEIMPLVSIWGFYVMLVVG